MKFTSLKPFVFVCLTTFTCAANAIAEEKPIAKGAIILGADKSFKFADTPIIVGEESVFFDYKIKSNIPNIEVENSVSNPLALRSLAKSETAIHLWSIDCAPCLAEMREFAKFAKKYNQSGKRMIFLSKDSGKKRIMAIARFKQLTNGKFESYYLKNDYQFATSFKTFMPQTIFYNAKYDEIATGVAIFPKDFGAISKWLKSKK